MFYGGTNLEVALDWIDLTRAVLTRMGCALDLWVSEPCKVWPAMVGVCAYHIPTRQGPRTDLMVRVLGSLLFSVLPCHSQGEDEDGVSIIEANRGYFHGEVPG